MEDDFSADSRKTCFGDEICYLLCCHFVVYCIKVAVYIEDVTVHVLAAFDIFFVDGIQHSNVRKKPSGIEVWQVHGFPGISPFTREWPVC